jgi:hypothetical protein
MSTSTLPRQHYFLAAAGLAFAAHGALAEDAPNSFFQGWSAGIALVRPSQRIVADASIVNNSVRLSDSSTFQAKFILAKHWYFESDRTDLRGKCAATIAGACVGLMVNAGVGSDQLIDLLGGGIVLGWGDPSKEKTPQSRDHNLGIGVGRLFHQRMLGKGFSADAPPPAGESQIRYRFSDTSAWYVFYTYTLR